MAPDWFDIDFLYSFPLFSISSFPLLMLTSFSSYFPGVRIFKFTSIFLPAAPFLTAYYSSYMDASRSLLLFEDIDDNCFEILCSLNCLFHLNSLSLWWFPQMPAIPGHPLTHGSPRHSHTHAWRWASTHGWSHHCWARPGGPAADPLHASVETLNTSSGFSSLLLEGA